MNAAARTLIKVVPVAVVLVSLSLVDSRACTCGRVPWTTPQIVDKYEAVFLGQVIGIRTPNRFTYEVEFEVQAGWKGIESTKLKLHTAADIGMCGFPFAKDKEYLVFAIRLNDGNLSASRCSPTREAPTIPLLVEVLGRPQYQPADGNQFQTDPLIDDPS